MKEEKWAQTFFTLAALRFDNGRECSEVEKKGRAKGSERPRRRFKDDTVESAQSCPHSLLQSCL